MINKADILHKLKELKPFLKKEYAVNSIGLFGSFATNEATAESDIDLLVELDKPIGWGFFSLEIFLEQTFGRKIDLVTQNALRPAMQDDILNNINYV